METTITILLALIQGFNHIAEPVPELAEIPIYVTDTWEITYATDIQDIYCYQSGNQLFIRSNGDGKIYIANLNDCSYQGEIDLPEGAEGFGIAVKEGRCYINSSTSSQIFHSDGSDTWAEFENPAGAGGAGMDFDCWSGDSDLFQATAASPYQFYSIDTDDYSTDSFSLPGVNGEISGFMTHEVMTLNYYDPYALILTTRFGHEFFFFSHSGNEYVQYGQEECPVTVEESLGISWNLSGYSPVYWSYKGIDGKYYVSSLQIPVFGGIEEESGSVSPSSCLGISSNPCIESACLTVNAPSNRFASLEVYDITGRLVQQMFNGQLLQGDNIFSFSGSPGIYTAVLIDQNSMETVRFVLVR